MSSAPPRTLRERAIALLKDGRSADELGVVFVAEGADPDEVRSVLTELVALQRRAAALDPERLRGEAHWMFARGAAVEHVVAHFVSVGVDAADAKPEAERLYAIFRTMRPCQRCGAPTPPRNLVFDLRGFSICNACNLRDEINRSEQRGVARDLEAIGAFGGGLSLTASVIASAIDSNDATGTTNPFCAHCRTPSGVNVATLHPSVRARLDPRWAWVCSRCWQPIA